MKTSTANFSIALQPSRALTISFGSLHLLAAIAIIFLSIPVWFKALLLLLLVVMAYKTIKQYALFKADNSIIKLNCASKNKCRIELANGKVYQATIVTANWLFNYFAILVLQTHVKKFNVTIAKDTMSQEQSYTLRLYLRSLNK